MGCYPHFILTEGRSRRFGSMACDWVAHFTLAFATAPSLKDLATPPTVTRRPIMQKVRGHTFRSRLGKLSLRRERGAHGRAPGPQDLT